MNGRYDLKKMIDIQVCDGETVNKITISQVQSIVPDDASRGDISAGSSVIRSIVRITRRRKLFMSAMTTTHTCAQNARSMRMSRIARK